MVSAVLAHPWSRVGLPETPTRGHGSTVGSGTRAAAAAAAAGPGWGVPAPVLAHGLLQELLDPALPGSPGGPAGIPEEGSAAAAGLCRKLPPAVQQDLLPPEEW